MSTSLNAFGFPLFIIPVDNSFSPRNSANTLSIRGSFNSIGSTNPASLVDSPKEFVTVSSTNQNGSRSCPIYNETKSRKMLSFTSVLKEGWERQIAKMKQESNLCFQQF